VDIGFYYHTPVFLKNGEIYVPSYLGVFIDSLANKVNSLTLIMHEEFSQDTADYALKSANFKLMSLGKKTPAWHRILFHRKLLKAKLDQIHDLDFVIVRSPSPLAPYFSNYLGKNKIILMVVGDYWEGAIQMKSYSLRSILIKGLLYYSDFFLKRRMKILPVLVNSPSLFKKYKSIANNIDQIKTTTLSQKDFFLKETKKNLNEFHLLYTGRIDLAKGLIELINAFSIICKNGKMSYRLDIVGWELDKTEPIMKKITHLSKELGVLDKVKFYPKMSIGADLNKMYRKADIYIIPSYYEGFPRTIWEAMANSCPVIATKVGSIPHFLQHKQNAYLIESKSVQQIVNAIEEISEDSILRSTLVLNGYALAKENTLEIQTSLMLQKINKLREE
jgi:glycosyltransferase involved in cell wall biosynthesis